MVKKTLDGSVELLKQVVDMPSEGSTLYFGYGLPSSLIETFKAVDHRRDLVVRISGKKLITIPKDWGISKELRLFGVHEPMVSDLLRRELTRGMHCVEIGANLGYYMLLESWAIGPNGAITAFEPVKKTFGYLRQTVALNGLSNVRLFQYAIGDTDGTASMAISTWASNLNRIETDRPRERTEDSTDGEQVPIMRLDTFAREFPFSRLDFLRMDVEGYEYSIISGALETIAKFNPAILIEMHVSIMGPAKTLALLITLRDLGYAEVTCIPRLHDYASTAHILRKTWNMDISQLIQKVRSGELRSAHAYNVYFRPTVSRQRP